MPPPASVQVSALKKQNEEVSAQAATGAGTLHELRAQKAAADKANQELKDAARDLKSAGAKQQKQVLLVCGALFVWSLRRHAGAKDTVRKD